MATLTARELSNKITCSQISKLRDGSGEFIFRGGYFYTGGFTSNDFRAKIVAQLKSEGLEYTIRDSGDHWAAFKGSASIAKQSHWWVVASVTKKEVA